MAEGFAIIALCQTHQSRRKYGVMILREVKNIALASKCLQVIISYLQVFRHCSPLAESNLSDRCARRCGAHRNRENHSSPHSARKGSSHWVITTDRRNVFFDRRISSVIPRVIYLG
jgi:hypothetical protein